MLPPLKRGEAVGKEEGDGTDTAGRERLWNQAVSKAGGTTVRRMVFNWSRASLSVVSVVALTQRSSWMVDGEG